MEEMFDILPWFFGITIAGAIGGAAIGAKAGSIGAVTGVIGGPIIVWSVLGAGAMGMVGARELSDKFLRKHKWVHCREQHPGIEKDCNPPLHCQLIHPLKWKWQRNGI